MGTITRINIHNYRSIHETINIVFPPKSPLVLIGENNSGKSNIIRALDLVLGEYWPGNHELEDHEYFNRIKDNVPVEIIINVDNVKHESSGSSRDVSAFCWICNNVEDEKKFTIKFINGDSTPYVSTDTKEKCFCILLSADRRLSYQLSYATKNTLLSKLMRQFHISLTEDEERVKKLREYFGNVKEVFNQVEPFKKFTEVLNQKVLEFSDNLNYGLKTDFSAYDPSNYFHSLKVLPYENDSALNFEELGTGQEQILALSFVYAYAKAFHGVTGDIILLVEEPEAHLHPLAQRWLAQKILELSEIDVQVIITTHSPAFINLLKLSGLALIKKVDKATKVKQLNAKQLTEYCVSHGVASLQVNENNILPFYSVASTEEILTGFFARKIVLVEGESESLALPVYFSKLGFNVTKNGVAIIPVHGKGNLCKWWRLFSAYDIPTYVIFDNDSENDEDLSRRLDVLRSLRISENDYEGLLAETTIKVGRRCAIFGIDFESSLRDIFGDEYRRLEEEARKTGLNNTQSKPLVARYVAEHISFDETDDRWESLVTLLDNINAVAPI